MYAALIRGAIAFGLSQNLAPGVFGDHTGADKSEVEVVQNTILSLVIITTVFIGGATPMVQRCLLTPAKPERELPDRISGVLGVEDDSAASQRDRLMKKHEASVVDE